MAKSTLLSSKRLAAIAALFVLATLASPNLRADFDADLEGIDADETSWGDGKLTGWKELEYIPCRVALNGGPATGRTITILFDHTHGSIPGIQDLSNWRPSANVVITSWPVLSAPAGSDVWSYTFTIDLLDTKNGAVEFHARLALGSHRNDRSLIMTGTPSLGTLPVEPPKSGATVPDLALVKQGPATAAPGDVISYAIHWSSQPAIPTPSTGTRITDVLPPELEYIPGSATGGAVLIGQTLVWTLGTLPAGAAGTITYQATVRPGTAFGTTFRNEAGIVSSEPDVEPSDNLSVVSTTVTPPRPPAVRDDAYSLDEDGTLTVSAPGVMANDTDSDGSPLRFATSLLATAPAHGVLVLNADGSFTYTPAGNFNGSDAFTYVVIDRTTVSAPATVFITVNPVADIPLVGVDAFSTDEDVTLSIPMPGVLSNDSGFDGYALSAVLVSSPAHGALSLNANGGFIYTPAPDYYGPDSFAYLATDGYSHSSPVTVNLTVRPVNDSPAFVTGPSQIVAMNSSARTVSGWATGLRAGPDNESRQVCSFEITGNSMPGLFAEGPAVSADGTLAFTPAPNAFGVATVTLRVRDDGGVDYGGRDVSTEQTFAITVNSPPTVGIVSPIDRAVFHAPAMFASLMAEAADADGAVTNVEVRVGGQLEARSSLPRVLHPLMNLRGGTYTFMAIATDNFGASSTSAPVTITIEEQLPLEVVQTLRLDPQSGLFKELVLVRNVSTATWPAARLLVQNLDSNVKVWNATGHSNDIPFLQINRPVPPGSNVVFVIEYYVPTRQMPTNRVLAVAPTGEVPSSPHATTDGTTLAVTRQVRLASGDFMIEWVSIPGRTYYVQYTSDLREWKTAVPAVTGTGTRQQWIDNGAPKTESHPNSGAMRCYRLLLIP